MPPPQSVLEAGTAVFVDPYGRPTVKCYCGNPLTPPVLYASPTYTGTLWAGFSTTSITIIQQSTTIIKQFILYDPGTGQLYPQTPGINGKSGPYQEGPRPRRGRRLRRRRPARRALPAPARPRPPLRSRRTPPCRSHQIR